jgi:hypothetical protein
MPPALRRAVPAIAAIVIAAAMGLYSKRLYHGPAAGWVHDSLGGVFYEIFWCLALSLALPRWRAARIALVVLIATCILEFLQLWHPPLLEWLRANFIGRTILGSYFDWTDFPYYFLGSAAGLVCLKVIGRD